MKNNKRQWKTRVEGEEQDLLYAVGDADAAEEAAERHSHDMGGEVAGLIEVDAFGEDWQCRWFDEAIVYEPRFRAAFAKD